MADIVFVGCNLAEAAAPLTPAGGAAPRRPVVLGGRLVKTVNVHAHCAVCEHRPLERPEPQGGVICHTSSRAWIRLSPAVACSRGLLGALLAWSPGIRAGRILGALP